MSADDPDLPARPVAESDAGEPAGARPPRRRRAPRSAAVDAGVSSEPAAVPAGGPQGVDASAPATGAASAPATGAAGAAEAASGGVSFAGERSPESPGAGPDAGPGAESTGSTPGQPKGEEGAPGGRRRRRSRNRGRRGRDAALEASGDQPAQEGVAGLPLDSDPQELFEAVVSGVYDTDWEAQVSAPAGLDEPRPDFGAADGGGAGEGADGGNGGEAAPPGSGAEQVPGEGPARADIGPEDAQASGAGDARADAPARRVLEPDSQAPKLHKVLAQSGLGSRRDLEQMILAGRVTVNGEPAHTGQRVAIGDQVAIDGRPVKLRIAPAAARVLAYHKPVGEVVTHDDPQARPTVFRRLPRLPHGKWQSVGRLDINTEGLLLFTNSGDLANRLMHPRFGVEREYAVRVLGLLSDEDRERLLQGVEIEGQKAAFLRIVDGGGEGANHWYRVVIAEGRNREVRKLFEAAGHAVSRLIRIRYGSVVLPRGLRRGAWVDLSVLDVKALREATGLARPGQAGGAPAGSSRARGRGEGPVAQEGREGREAREGRPGREGREGSREGRRGRRGRHAGEGRFEPMPGLAGPAPGAFEGEGEDDEAIGPIPNPLVQTYDRRALAQSRQVREYGEDGPIPNPLMQTYDRRALQAERQPRREIDEDGPIPNPLVQTYDRRFAQPGAKPGGGRGGGKGGSKGGGKGGGQGGSKGPGQAGAPRRGKPGRPSGAGAAGERQPDPMRTSVGYIGGDALLGKGRGGGKGGRRGGKR